MYSAIWLNSQHNEIVFENRFRDYGAYMLRQRYEKTMAAAMTFAIGLFLIICLTAILLKKKSVSLPDELKIKEIILQDIKVEEPTPKLPPRQSFVPPSAIPQIQYVPPRVVVDETPAAETNVPTQENLVDIQIGTTTTEGDPDATGIIPDEIRTGPAVIEEEPAAETIHTFVEQQPEFPGGEKALMKYITNNLKFPPMAKEASASGTVVVRFVVNKEGFVENAIIVHSPSSLFNKAALEVFKKMPQWRPGKMNGKAVSVYFTIPLRFELR